MTIFHLSTKPISRSAGRAAVAAAAYRTHADGDPVRIAGLAVQADAHSSERAKATAEPRQVRASSVKGH